MRVALVAHTALSDASALNSAWASTLDPETTDADALAEGSGRACYQAWSRPNPATRKNVDYLRHIIDSGHFSVLEHASATFYIEGVSRSLTHELIRHRHLSYSQLSQRFVNEEDAEFVVPPALEGTEEASDILENNFRLIIEDYNYLVRMLQDDKGLTRKQAREAARAVLPNMTETKIVVTGNMRAWRDFLSKRWHVAADAEIRQLAGEILKQLRTVAPNSFQDVPEEPYGN